MNILHNINASVYVATNVRSYLGGTIKGKVTKVDVAYPCIVSIHERESRSLIESKITDKAGNYAFHNLSYGFSFFLVAIDPAKKFNAVIQDSVVPK